MGEQVQRVVSAMAIAMVSLSGPAGAAVLAPVTDASAQLTLPAAHLARAIPGQRAVVERRGSILLTIDADSLRAVAPLQDGAPDRLKDLTLDGLAGAADLSVVRPKPGGAPGEEDAVTADRLPEPTTWLMIFFGFFGLSFAVRRRDRGSRTRVRFT
jgi:hypothetical protein